MSTLVGLFDSELNNFMDKPESAKALLNLKDDDIGDPEENSNLAAYTYVANAIFNLDETIRKS